MKQYLFSRRTLGWALVLSACALLPAQGASAATAPTCPTPALSQPFLSIGDSNRYTLAPGESADNFAGAGWTLSGGASIITTQLSDGMTGSVLVLPAGARAVSPAICVAGGYSTARMVTRVLGTSASSATTFAVSPAGSTTQSGGMPVLAKTSWAASAPVNVAPGNSAAELVQLRLAAGAKAPTIQVYNLYVDPRMH